MPPVMPPFNEFIRLGAVENIPVGFIQNRTQNRALPKSYSVSLPLVRKRSTSARENKYALVIWPDTEEANPLVTPATTPNRSCQLATSNIFVNSVVSSNR